MIPEAYAVTDPRAMVIHSSNTSIALSTMVNSWRFDGFAVDAGLEELLPNSFQLVQTHHYTDLKLLSRTPSDLSLWNHILLRIWPGNF
jgi:hypothetical protein